jgi:hypothetical protein
LNIDHIAERLPCQRVTLSTDIFCLVVADGLVGRLSLDGFRPVIPEKSGRGSFIFRNARRRGCQEQEEQKDSGGAEAWLVLVSAAGAPASVVCALLFVGPRAYGDPIRRLQLRPADEENVADG